MTNDHSAAASGVGAVSSIVPVFRDSGFDAEATQALGKAYDIACVSLHPSGRPPVVQGILARKIIECAQRGERDPDRLAGAFRSWPEAATTMSAPMSAPGVIVVLNSKTNGAFHGMGFYE